MSSVTNPYVDTRCITKSTNERVDAEGLSVYLEQFRKPDVQRCKIVGFATEADLETKNFNLSSWTMEETTEVAADESLWKKLPELGDGFEAVTPSTCATCPTSSTISTTRQLLRNRRRDERLSKLPADRRAIYERIRQLRDEIGPVGFNVLNGLRELRNNA